ncbi:hypothetical protein EVA_14791 [gut metagenome]|uniref:Uncharacterized protein n=1 Tax=gut metagenome TaxID=749906 RepID=J9CB36_9ZZZZ
MQNWSDCKTSKKVLHLRCTVGKNSLNGKMRLFQLQFVSWMLPASAFRCSKIWKKTWKAISTA